MRLSGSALGKHLFDFNVRGSTVLNNDRRAREKGLPGGDIAGMVAMDVEVLRVRPPDALMSPAQE